MESPQSRTADARDGHRWSLERKLPLLMTGLLAVMLAVSLALTYATLARSARIVATERLERVADQLQSLASASITRVRGRLATAASDRAIQQALVAPAAGADGARSVLERLLGAADTGLTVELWSADGRRVAHAGRDLRAGDGAPRPAGAGEGTEVPTMPATVGALATADSVQVGALHLIGGVPHFWVVAPVRVGGVRRGYLARQYRIDGGARAEETIRALTGVDVSTYYRNADGGLWTTIAGRPASAPARDSGGGEVVMSRHGLGELLVMERPIAGAPFLLVIERSAHRVLVAPRATLKQLTALSAALLLIGALASLLIGRRIARPLVALTDAAEAVARGDYEARVEPQGDDELRRLAESFNHMAGNVGAAREELQAREAEFRALANAVPQLSWMAHPDGAIFWLNDRFCEYTGRTPAQLERWGWQSVHDPAMLPLVMERWSEAMATGEQFEMEYPLRAADGGMRWFLARAHPVRDAAGRVVRWFGTGTDVQALRDAREAAEAANRAKSDFLAMMSHELRTPLNAIGGYTELLQLGLRGPLTEAQQRDLGRIRASQEHLLGLISGVLDLSRIESGRVSYELAPVALTPFLAGLDALIEPQAAAKSLVLQHQPTAPGLGALADREKLRQILLNLLSNAIRYTPAGGRVELAAAAVNGTTVAISVSDTGGGIDPEKRDRIFEPFVQLDRSLTRVREGVGLGLAISRDLARGMGGEITVESEVGVGSRFTLTLPRATVHEEEARLDVSDEHPVARGTR